MKTIHAISRFVIAIALSAGAMHSHANETKNPWLNNACSMPEYDGSMLRGDEKGTVKLRFATDASGKVIDAKIEESSGYVKLDRASIAALKNCRFDGASNAAIAESAEAQNAKRITFAWSIK
ncbi:energy transducer TonB family protein [Undibacterium fentianense]|uniref:Energy transducer TonB n=1 Tax=Undibacterium fentianense TaxID=2828728 RepID=A0A941E0B8_9BURK|nr:energy transducer TonB [Undibacterium fentianense]MBR7800080.1 energy transducer TonB [Undibacterium fentianense]